MLLDEVRLMLAPRLMSLIVAGLAATTALISLASSTPGPVLDPTERIAVAACGFVLGWVVIARRRGDC
jgi:hypothetical protein